MSSRPPSRIFTLPIDQDNINNPHIYQITTILDSLNPRAFSQNPPLFVNKDALKKLFSIIQFMKQMQLSIITPNTQTHVLVLTQLNIIIYLYNHLAFLMSNHWIPQ